MYVKFTFRVQGVVVSLERADFQDLQQLIKYLKNLFPSKELHVQN